VLATLLTAILFGLSPAITMARQNLIAAAGTRVTRGLRGRNLLVVAQVSVCVLLLTGAVLMVRTLDRMRSMNAGFDRDHVVTFTIDPSLRRYTPEQTKRLSQELLEKSRTLPGVVTAANAGRGLMRGTGLKATFAPAGTPITPGDFLNSSLNAVSPGYFEAMGMRLLEGRDFTRFEVAKERPRKVIVNHAFARKFFPGQSALGKTFGAKGKDGLALADQHIVGVVSDAKYRSLREEIPPTVYGAVVDGFDSTFILHLRTHGEPSALIGPVREILRSLDPELPFVEVSTLRSEVETSLWQERLLAWISTLFGAFSAAIAALGLYGVLDSWVKARTREIGIRTALGADSMRIARLLGGHALLLVAAGSILGLGLHLVLGRSLERVLYGVSPSDPVAMVIALLVIAAIVCGAALIPVWRAISIEPGSALRTD
jgi:predicted permease